MSGLSCDKHAVPVIEAMLQFQQAAFLWLKEDRFQNSVTEQRGKQVIELGGFSRMVPKHTHLGFHSPVA